MKKIFAVALGILTAIGGFVDIGDLVTNAQVGARFGLSLGWVVIVGIIGICVFAEMSGRVAAVSGRATFDIVRERLGPRVGLANLLASMAVTLLTFVAEIGGVALALQLVTSVSYLLVVPFVAFAGVADPVAGEVLGHGERARAARAGADRVRGRAVAARARTGATCCTRWRSSTSPATSSGGPGPTTPSRCSAPR